MNGFANQDEVDNLFGELVPSSSSETDQHEPKKVQVGFRTVVWEGRRTEEGPWHPRYQEAEWWYNCFKHLGYHCRIEQLNQIVYSDRDMANARKHGVTPGPMWEILRLSK